MSKKKVVTKIIQGNKNFDYSFLIVKDKKTGKVIHRLRMDSVNDHELFIEKLKIKYLL